MDIMLENVRLHAIEQIKSQPLSEEEQEQLFDAIAEVLILSRIGREEGLLALETAAEEMDKKIVHSELLKNAVNLVCDGTDPDIITEILTSNYWVDSQSRIEYVVAYIYLRGILMVQDGMNPRVLEEILYAMVPSICREKGKEWSDQIVGLYRDKKLAEILERYEKIDFVPSEQEVILYAGVLEQKLRAMPDWDIQRALRDIDNEYLTNAMIALSDEAKEILFANMSRRLSYMIKTDIVHKVWCLNGEYRADEAAIEKALEIILSIIERLTDAGEFIGDFLYPHA